MAAIPMEEKLTELLAALTIDNIIRVARILQQIQDANPASLVPLAKRVGIARRKAYSLARISRIFSNLEVDDETMEAIGWTKLQILCVHINAKNRDRLIDLGLSMNAHHLAAKLRGDHAGTKTRTLVLHLKPDDFEFVRALLLANGAVKSRGGLICKEKALMQILRPNPLEELDFRL